MGLSLPKRQNSYLNYVVKEILSLCISESTEFIMGTESLTCLRPPMHHMFASN